MFDKALQIWDRLTLPKLLLAIAASISAVCIYTLWEQRDAVFITLTGSVFAMASIAAGIGLFFVAAVCWLFVGALDRKTDLTHKALNDRIVDLQTQVNTQNVLMDRMRDEYAGRVPRGLRARTARMPRAHERHAHLVRATCRAPDPQMTRLRNTLSFVIPFLVALGGVLVGVPIVLAVGPMYEPRIAPVVRNVALLSATREGSAVIFDVAGDKARTCTYLGASALAGPREGLMEQAKLSFPVAMGKGVTRPPGFQSFGVWRIEPVRDGEVVLIQLRHHCHSFWDTTTLLGPWRVLPVSSVTQIAP
jgi:hypothetical protein